MSIAQGFNRFLAYKSQTAHGTKASGLTSSMVALRSGTIFNVNPILQAQADAINALAPFGAYRSVPKIVPWQASVLFYNPTTAHATVRDFLRSVFGRETTAAGPPLTKTFDVFDPLIDGGTDSGTVLYGRCLTLHEEGTKTDGTIIYADEVQDAVIQELSLIWEPDQQVRMEMSGMASDLQPGATHVTPTYPDGQLFGFQNVKDTATAGLRIGTANPPTATDNVIFSRAALTIRNEIRYVPFLGNGSTKQVRIPTRNGRMQITLDVTLDVEDAISNQYDSSDMFTDWKNGAALNIDFLSYVDANNILDFKVTAAANRGAFLEKITRSAPNEGAMQATATFRMAPQVLTDLMLKLTTVS